MKGIDGRSVFSIMQLGAAAPVNYVFGVLCSRWDTYYLYTKND